MKNESFLVVSDSATPWNSPGQNTGVSSLSLFQGSSQPRDRTRVSCVTGRLFTNWAIRKAQISANFRYPSKNKQHQNTKKKKWINHYKDGTWNVRPMNQGKLEVVKQMMARMNVNILVISELKWTGMGEFNSDDHYIYYCGQESLKRNGVAIIVNKKSKKCSTWMQSQKWHNELCLFQRKTIHYHGNPSLCP